MSNLLQRNYDRAAWFYDTSASVYSANQISASKKHQLQYIQPGEKAIFLGVGSGEEAVDAASKGADVTCVDISPSMLNILKSKLNDKDLNASLICDDALRIEDFGRFDVCCANFFFNVFREPELIQAMSHAIKLLKPGGKLLIADVALAQGNIAYRAFNLFYRKIAMFSFWCLGLVPLHRDHDYRKQLLDMGFEIDEQKFFRLLPFGPVVFQCIAATKQDAIEEL